MNAVIVKSQLAPAGEHRADLAVAVTGERPKTESSRTVIATGSAVLLVTVKVKSTF